MIIYSLLQSTKQTKNFNIILIIYNFKILIKYYSIDFIISYITKDKNVNSTLALCIETINIK